MIPTLQVGGLGMRRQGSAAGTDPFFANVVSLLHFDGADGSTTFTDVIGRTWTPFGDAQLDTAQFKFGTASLLLDGTGDYLTAASSADFAFGTGDYCVEGWFRVANTTGNKNFFTFGANWNVYAGGNAVIVWDGSANAIVSSSILVAGAWVHIAIARSSGTTRLFVGGVLIGSVGTMSGSVAAATFYLGHYSSGTAFWNGHIDDVRITKGVARYTASFTPPSAPFPNS